MNWIDFSGVDRRFWSRQKQHSFKVHEKCIRSGIKIDHRRRIRHEDSRGFIIVSHVDKSRAASGDFNVEFNGRLAMERLLKRKFGIRQDRSVTEPYQPR